MLSPPYPRLRAHQGRTKNIWGREFNSGATTGSAVEPEVEWAESVFQEETVFKLGFEECTGVSDTVVGMREE